MKQILVVDDNIPFSNMLKQLLEKEGYSVKTAANGREAIELIEADKIRPDLIITDIIMPEMEGLEFIRKIKVKYARLKIIAISGGGRHISAILPLKTAQLLGVDRIFEKPLDHPKFLSDIRILFKE